MEFPEWILRMMNPRSSTEEQFELEQRAGGGHGKAGVPWESEEQAVVADLMHLALGVDGELFRLQDMPSETSDEATSPEAEIGRGCRLVAHAGVPGPFASAAAQLTLLAVAVRRLQAFSYESALPGGGGLCRQALGGAVRSLLELHYRQVAEQRSRQRQSPLRLTEWVVRMTRQQRLFGLVVRLCAHIQRKALRGGAVLNFLHEQSFRCADLDTLPVLEYLTAAVSAPYETFLRRWVRFGRLLDPYGEFMVQRSSGSNGGYSENPFLALGFKLRPDSAIPVALTDSSSQILLAGIYRHVLSELRQTSFPLEEEEGSRGPSPHTFKNVSNLVEDESFVHAIIHYHKMGSIHGDDDEGKLEEEEEEEEESELSRGGPMVQWIGGENIREAYNRAEHALACRLLLGSRADEHFQFMREVFLAGREEWLQRFVRQAQFGLARPAAQMDEDALSDALEDCLHASFASGGDRSAFWRLVRAKRASSGLLQELQQIDDVLRAASSLGDSTVASSVADEAAFNVLQLTYQPPSPHHVLFPPPLVAKYQLLFRRLFGLAWLEETMRSAWVLLKAIAAKSGTEGGLRLRPAHVLVQEVSQMLRQLRGYCLTEGVAREWAPVVEALASQSLSKVVQAHASALDRMLRSLLLSDVRSARLLDRVCTVAALVSSTVDRLHRALPWTEVPVRFLSALQANPALSQLEALHRRFRQAVAALAEELARRSRTVHDPSLSAYAFLLKY